jgi:hypothetical protein
MVQDYDRMMSTTEEARGMTRGTPDRPNMSSEFDRMDAALERLQKVASAFIDKVGPVVGPEFEGRGEDVRIAADKRDDVSILVAGMQARTATINDVAAMLDRFRERIEL